MLSRTCEGKLADGCIRQHLLNLEQVGLEEPFRTHRAWAGGAESSRAVGASISRSGAVAPLPVYGVTRKGISPRCDSGAIANARGCHRLDGVSRSDWHHLARASENDTRGVRAHLADGRARAQGVWLPLTQLLQTARPRVSERETPRQLLNKLHAMYANAMCYTVHAHVHALYVLCACTALEYRHMSIAIYLFSAGTGTPIRLTKALS